MIGRGICRRRRVIRLSDFERFENRWIITGIISLHTPLRIGIGSRGAEYSVASSPVLLRYDAGLDRYLPFIPGSSLKGVIRTLSERITRTLGYDVCYTVLDKQNRGTNDRILCGKCEICRIFGGGTKGGQGAGIRVRDAVLSEDYRGLYRFTEERPHHADRYQFNRGMYGFEVDRRGRRWGMYRTEDEIRPLSFDLRIELDNVSEMDVGLILLTLDEFKHKRSHVGGGVSRGHGFAVVDDIDVEKIEIQPDTGKIFDFRRTASTKDEISHLKKLIEPKRDKEITGNDFDIYAHASDKTPNGCIVCEFEVEMITDFRMPGVEEETVTVTGVPVIPGSTIKGFLKKHFVKKWGAKTIDDIFGPAKPKFGHRSRILVSDAFNNVSTTDRISEGEKLKCWIVFDNMKKNDITEIINTLSSVQRITGKTSAEQINNGNVVQFSLKKAWKFCIDDFEYDVTSQLEAS